MNPLAYCYNLEEIIYIPGRNMLPSLDNLGYFISRRFVPSNDSTSVRACHSNTEVSLQHILKALGNRKRHRAAMAIGVLIQSVLGHQARAAVDHGDEASAQAYYRLTSTKIGFSNRKEV